MLPTSIIFMFKTRCCIQQRPAAFPQEIAGGAFSPFNLIFQVNNHPNTIKTGGDAAVVPATLAAGVVGHACHLISRVAVTPYFPHRISQLPEVSLGADLAATRHNTIPLVWRLSDSRAAAGDRERCSAQDRPKPFYRHFKSPLQKNQGLANLKIE